jgi:hypothetical protein
MPIMSATAIAVAVTPETIGALIRLLPVVGFVALTEVLITSIQVAARERFTNHRSELF